MASFRPDDSGLQTVSLSGEAVSVSQNQSNVSRGDRPVVAVWRRLPYEPATAFAWLLGGLNRVDWALAAIWALLPFASWAIVSALVQTIPFWPFVSIYVSGPGLHAIRRWSPLAFDALPTRTTTSDPLPALVYVYGRGGALGRDYGWIDFADGWLVYQGLRTDFALRTSDVRSRLVHERSVELFLSDGRRLQIAFAKGPYRRRLNASPTDHNRLVLALRNWLGGPLAEGESVLPPTRRHPENVATWLRLGATLAAYFGLFGVFGLVFPNTGLALALLPSTGLLAFVVYRSVRLQRDLLHDAELLRERMAPSSPLSASGIDDTDPRMKR